MSQKGYPCYGTVNHVCSWVSRIQIVSSQCQTPSSEVLVNPVMSTLGGGRAPFGSTAIKTLFNHSTMGARQSGFDDTSPILGEASRYSVWPQRIPCASLVQTGAVVTVVLVEPIGVPSTPMIWLPILVVLVVLATDLWVFTDAKTRLEQGNPIVISIGSYDVNTPAAWVVLRLLLWIIFFPLYISSRRNQDR